MTATDTLALPTWQEMTKGVPDRNGDYAFDFDGEHYLVIIEPDPDFSIFDEEGEGMWIGRLSWAMANRDRPADFDGGAEVIYRDRSANLWWQPEPDVIRDEKLRSSIRAEVSDAFEHGYALLTVARVCEHGGVIDSCGLGGISWNAEDDYMGEMAREMLGEVLP